MTNTDKIIALAKLDGWDKIEESSSWEQWDEPPAVRMMVCNSERRQEAPAYLTSYDAIIPLVQKQDYEIRTSMTDCLISDYWSSSIKHSPSEIADALLKAKGLM